MEYKIIIDDFEGPMDLLLHLIKQSDIDIFDINIVDIADQYLNYIVNMEELNLNIASSYLVMAAELIELKSLTLLPSKVSVEDDYEEDPREQLINKLVLYKQYKEVTSVLKDMEENRRLMFSKEPSDLKQFKVNEVPVENEEVSLDDLVDAFNLFLDRKEEEKPLNAKITTKEYSVTERGNEIRKLLKNNKRMEFTELFDNYSKDYIVVTFLSILDLARKQHINIEQENNFKKIYLTTKGSV